MTQWPSVTIKGETYPLDHLHPFSVSVELVDGINTFQCRIRVSFNSHCFTEDLDESIHTPDLHYQDGSEMRAFSFARYRHTRLIRPAIEAALDRKVYFSQDRNFFVLETVADAGGPCAYPIYFDLRPSSQKDHKLAMFVVSAYPKANLPARHRLPSIRFKMLAIKKLRGQAVYPP